MKSYLKYAANIYFLFYCMYFIYFFLVFIVAYLSLLCLFICFNECDNVVCDPKNKMIMLFTAVIIKQKSFKEGEIYLRQPLSD